MWKSNDDTQSAQQANSLQPPVASPSAKLDDHSTIGKSIVIKGEVVASHPIYVYGSVEGSINAPAHRVTVGPEGRLKADVSAREVVIMGDVLGRLNSDDRVEIRRDGSLMGEVIANRICIEEGALVKGAIDTRRRNEKEKQKLKDERPRALDEAAEAVSVEQLDLDNEAYSATA